MKPRFNKPDLGLTGQMAEAQMFGTVENPIEFEDWQQRLRFEIRINKPEAMRWARESQPTDDITSPETHFALDLYGNVANRIGLPTTDYQRLKFYTAVKSPLDYGFGTDAFFDFETESGETITVTIDGTTYQKHNWTADVLIIYPPEDLDLKDPQDKERWKKIIGKASMEIADLINRQRGDWNKEEAHD